MLYSGKVRLDKRTKDLVKRLDPSDIALIDHKDMDRVSAESLIAAGVDLVINAAPSISGAYPNVGPVLLVKAGVTLLDDIGPEPFNTLKEGALIYIDEDGSLYAGTEPSPDTHIATGVFQTPQSIEAAYTEAQKSISIRLDEFAQNTLRYLAKEKNIISDDQWVPSVATTIAERHVLVVVRGYHYKEDIDVLKSYIREMKPVLIGVDGGADALIEAGFQPDIIIGDMDSVTHEALRSGAELIVHAYADGHAPGLEPLEQLGLADRAIIWPLTATSEDLALILAWEKGAALIVAVGTHNNLVEYLDKGRAGMSSSFLVRLKIGPKLVDAKGVSRLYRSSVSPGMLFPLLFAALFVILTLIFISPAARNLFTLLVWRLRVLLGL